MLSEILLEIVKGSITPVLQNDCDCVCGSDCMISGSDAQTWSLYRCSRKCDRLFMGFGEARLSKSASESQVIATHAKVVDHLRDAFKIYKIIQKLNATDRITKYGFI